MRPAWPGHMLRRPAALAAEGCNRWPRRAGQPERKAVPAALCSRSVRRVPCSGTAAAQGKARNLLEVRWLEVLGFRAQDILFLSRQVISPRCNVLWSVLVDFFISVLCCLWRAPVHSIDSSLRRAIGFLGRQVARRVRSSISSRSPSCARRDAAARERLRRAPRLPPGRCSQLRHHKPRGAACPPQRDDSDNSCSDALVVLHV